MGIIDTVKQAMHGRSGMVEKVIDGAVERAGKYSESLKVHGEGLKDKARSLDEGRAGTGEASGTTTATTSTATAAGEPTTPAAPPVEVVDVDAPPTSALKGDLVPDRTATPPPVIDETTPPV